MVNFCFCSGFPALGGLLSSQLVESITIQAANDGVEGEICDERWRENRFDFFMFLVAAKNVEDDDSFDLIK